MEGTRDGWKETDRRTEILLKVIIYKKIYQRISVRTGTKHTFRFEQNTVLSRSTSQARAGVMEQLAKKSHLTVDTRLLLLPTTLSRREKETNNNKTVISLAAGYNYIFSWVSQEKEAFFNTKRFPLGYGELRYTGAERYVFVKQGNDFASMLNTDAIVLSAVKL